MYLKIMMNSRRNYYAKYANYSAIQFANTVRFNVVIHNVTSQPFVVCKKNKIN